MLSLTRGLVHGEDGSGSSPGDVRRSRARRLVALACLGGVPVFALTVWAAESGSAAVWALLVAVGAVELVAFALLARRERNRS